MTTDLISEAHIAKTLKITDRGALHTWLDGNAEVVVRTKVGNGYTRYYDSALLRDRADEIVRGVKALIAKRFDVVKAEKKVRSRLRGPGRTPAVGGDLLKILTRLDARISKLEQQNLTQVKMPMTLLQKHAA